MLSSHPCSSEGVPLLPFLLDTAAICLYVPFSMPLHADTCQYVLWLLWSAWVSLLSSLKVLLPKWICCICQCMFLMEAIGMCYFCLTILSLIIPCTSCNPPCSLLSGVSTNVNTDTFTWPVMAVTSGRCSTLEGCICCGCMWMAHPDQADSLQG